MALPIIEDARLETSEEYRLSFSLADAPGCGWSFPCDAAGNVDEAALHPDGLDNLRMCRAGQGRSGRGIDDRSGNPLDAYLQDLASWVEQRGYSMDSRRCLWCGNAARLRTGTLPYVGALWYCPSCADTYRTCKDRQATAIEEQEPELKTHYRDAWGASSCGVGHLTTANPARVTCKRCLAHHVGDLAR